VGRLKLVVFLCGATLMSLEMAGVRILNVYFGSTIYVWGAIIGIFLGALSLGYWLGGMLADRAPRFEVLGAVIFLSALFVFQVPWSARPLCEGLGQVDAFGPRLQALSSSLALYFVPSVLMGMVSPFAVRLAAREVKDVGKVAGRLYALSTLGSIVGTLGTAFVLVEFVGNRTTILALGATLVLAAVLTVDRRALRAKGALLGAVLAVPAWFGAQGPTVTLGPGYQVLEEFDSAYYHILVAEGPYGGTRARVLKFDRLVQSGIVVEDEPDAPVRSACGYTDLLHLGMVVRDAPPERVLFIGGGGGVGPMVFRQDYPSIERIDVVDVDPAVFRMAREYFRYPEPGADPVIRSHVADGRLYVLECDARYDYIVLDAYAGGGRIPFHLITKEFLDETAGLLTDDGVLVINVISAVRGPQGRLFRSVLKTLEAVDGLPQVYAFPRSYRGERSENVILVATRNPRRLSLDQITRRAARMERRDEIRIRTVDDYAGHLVTVEPDLGEAVVLTDDYAPTDSMSAP